MARIAKAAIDAGQLSIEARIAAIDRPMHRAQLLPAKAAARSNGISFGGTEHHELLGRGLHLAANEIPGSSPHRHRQAGRQAGSAGPRRVLVRYRTARHPHQTSPGGQECGAARADGATGATADQFRPFGRTPTTRLSMRIKWVIAIAKRCKLALVQAARPVMHGSRLYLLQPLVAVVAEDGRCGLR